MTDYFKMDGVDGDFFRCEKLWATLRVEACAQRFRDAAGGDNCSSCYRCPLGAKHAKVDIKPIKKTLCARCLTPSLRIVHGRLCVSCYNRTRETLLGSNAKGSRPRKLSAVYRGHVAIKVGDDWRSSTVDHVSGFVETLVSASRRDGGVLFDWASEVTERVNDGLCSHK